MYWPTNASKSLAVPSPLNREAVIALRQSRRGNLFATLSKDSLGVWDVRVSLPGVALSIRADNQPTVLQAVVVRSAASLQRWGENVDVFWSADGKGLIILVSALFERVEQSSLSDVELSFAGIPTSTHLPARLRSSRHSVPSRCRGRRR